MLTGVAGLEMEGASWIELAHMQQARIISHGYMGLLEICGVECGGSFELGDERTRVSCHM